MDDDEEFDDDFPDSEDDTLDLIVCPACGEEIYEEAEQCPYCGEYVVGDNRVLASKPLWYAALALAGVVAVVVVLSGLAALL